jgi:hypothetical protein
VLHAALPDRPRQGQRAVVQLPRHFHPAMRDRCAGRAGNIQVQQTANLSSITNTGAAKSRQGRDGDSNFPVSDRGHIPTVSLSLRQARDAVK